VKSPGLTGELLGELRFLRQAGVHGTLGGAVECVDIKRNADGEDSVLGCPDAETRKRGEQTGLDTPVVHAVNDVY
jgi:hypothetical protein